MGTYKIAVLLASYNGAEFIEEQVLSILTQTQVDLDLYISDDASSDETLEIIAKLQKRFRSIILFSTGVNSGSATRNFFKLISHVPVSKYEFFSFSDQDDIWFKDKLINSISLINKNNLSAYSSNVKTIFTDGSGFLLRKDQPQKDFDYMFESAGPGSTFVFTKIFFTELKNFVLENNNSLRYINNHDWFCYAFARSRGFLWFIDSRATLYYRQHQNNVIGVNHGFKAYLFRISQVFNQNFSKQVWITSEILGYKAELSKILPNNNFFLRLKFFLFFTKCRRRFRDAVTLLFFVIMGLMKDKEN